MSHCARAGLLLASLLCAACGAAGPSVTLHEDRQGSVALERVSDPAFQAAHPIILGPDLLARVLRGVRLPAQEETAAPAGGRATTRLFSEGQVVFLAPLLADALSKATPDQRVRFTARDATRPGVAPTTGLLFAHGRSLHLIIVPSPGAAPGPTLLFVPDVARRPESFLQVPGAAVPGGIALAVDYQLLASLPAAIERTGPPADLAQPRRAQEDGRGDEVSAMKDLIVEKDLEIQALKSDLERLKKQVADQAEQLRKLQGGKRPAAPGNGSR